MRPSLLLHNHHKLVNTSILKLAGQCVGLPEIFYGEGTPEVSEDFQKHPGPIASVAKLAQVRERFLR